MLLPISAILERYLTTVENCLVALHLLKRRNITSAGSFAGHQKEADFKILGATDGSFVFKQSCIILDFSLKTYLVNASNRKHSASLRLRPH